MTKVTIDLKKEHSATLATPRYKYSAMAKLFFFGMDLVAGKKDDLSKAKLLEILASIPYRVWEIRHYLKLTRRFRNLERVRGYQRVIDWGREAQDNEYMHLLVIHEKMKEDGIRDRWYLNRWLSFSLYLHNRHIKAYGLLSQKGFPLQCGFETMLSWCMPSW